MTKFELTIAILAGISLIGFVTLLFFEKETILLLPIVTSLFGWLIGKKEVLEKIGRSIVGKKK